MVEQEKLRKIATELKKSKDKLFFSACTVEGIIAYLRDGNCCQYCQNRDLFRDVETIKVGQTMDHLLPQNPYEHLKNDEWNLVPACSYCNQLKRNWDANSPKQSGKPSVYHGQGPLNKQQHDELLQRAKAYVKEKRGKQKQDFVKTCALWSDALKEIGRR